MNYGIDEKKRVTRTCKGWDRVSGDTETRVKCGKRYTTKAAAPIGACPACMAKLVTQFWDKYGRPAETETVKSSCSVVTTAGKIDTEFWTAMEEGKS